MQQILYTRSSRNHRDGHGPRLAAAGAVDAIGFPEQDLASTATRSRRHLMDGAAREARNVVPLFRPSASTTGRAETAIRVLLAEGQALIRAGYRALLESDELIEVVGEAASEEEALARASETRPDVALLDLGLLGFDDPESTARFISQPALANVAVMLIAPGKCDDHVLDAVLAGAAGVLAKDAGPTELIRAVQVVARGQALLPVHLVRQLFSELHVADGQRALPPGRLDELTERETEVVALVARGLSNHEIASRLVISPATAKTHVSRAMLKLDASHRAQLVVLAYEAGLVHARPRGEDWLASPRLASAL